MCHVISTDYVKEYITNYTPIPVELSSEKKKQQRLEPKFHVHYTPAQCSHTVSAEKINAGAKMKYNLHCK